MGHFHYGRQFIQPLPHIVAVCSERAGHQYQAGTYHLPLRRGCIIEDGASGRTFKGMLRI